MPPVVTDALPQVAMFPYVGISRWAGQHRFVSVGGRAVPFNFYATARAFNLDGTHTDEAVRPDGFCAQGDAGAAQGVATLSNGDLILVGGTDNNSQDARCQRFVAATQTWQAFPTPNGFVNSGPDFWPFGISGGSMVMFTAFFSGNMSGDSIAWRWTAAGGWAQIDFPLMESFGFYSVGTKLSNGNVLAVTMLASQADRFDWSVYSGGDTGSWSAPGTVNVSAPTVAVTPHPTLIELSGGKALLLFNYKLLGGDPVSLKAYVFDGAAWHAVPSPSIVRTAYGAAGSCAGEGFIFGGQQPNAGNAFTNSIERFTDTTELWDGFDTLPAPLRNVTGLVECVDGQTASRLYVAGGESAAGVFSAQLNGYACAGMCACGAIAPPQHELLIFDMRNPAGAAGADAIGQWYNWKPAGANVVGACMHQGVHHYLTDDGVVRFETPGTFLDDSIAQIQIAAHYAPLSPGKNLGGALLYRVQADGEYISPTTIRVTAKLGVNDVDEPIVWTADIVMTDATKEEPEFRPSPPRFTNLELIFEEQPDPAATGEGWMFRLVGLEIGARGKLRWPDVGQKVPG